MNQHFLEKCNPVTGFLPIDMGAGANDGDYVSLKNYHRCAVILQKEPGDAGNDPIITLTQAKTVAAGSAKALNITEIRKKQAATDLTAVGTFTKSTSASPATNDTFSTNTWTNSDLAEQAAIVVLDIKAEDLDIANDFDCIKISIADTGSAGQLGTVQYILHDPKYPAETLPSAIID